MIRLVLFSILMSLVMYSEAKPIEVFINGQPQGKASSYYLLSEDSIRLQASECTNWVQWLPELKAYYNSNNKLAPVHYHVKALKRNHQTLSFPSLAAGTYLFGKSTGKDSFLLESQALHLLDSNIIQVVVRQNDSYLGYLTEMLQTPFILPPKRIRFGFQTDLHIGTDCAELAIYGRRRMGYPVPYLGPRGIWDYLERADSAFAGAVLHFGFQVSVLFEDRGTIGEIDEEDLLIQAYEHSVHIIPIGETDLWGKAFKLMQWKE